MWDEAQKRLVASVTLGAEDTIHDRRLVVDDRAQLLAVDGLGRRRAARVSDELGARDVEATGRPLTARK